MRNIRNSLHQFLRCKRQDETKLIDIEHIINCVSDFFNMSRSCVFEKTRKREIVQVRQISMFFAKQHTRLSLEKIGNAVGGKDHATVLYACRTVNNLIETNKNYRNNIGILAKIIENKSI